ncbi:MAG: hypothetical protein Q9202_002629 [Teloschistes flavicans]
MSTQEDQGIAFHVAHDQQRLRLLELPPSLFSLATSKESRLWLKTTTPTEADPGHVVLCSDSQTFQVRQVHSSNSVFIIQPSCIARKDPRLDYSNGITAIAKCESTLEVIPHSPACLPLLREALPVFVDLESAQKRELAAIQTKQSILNDMPMSSLQYNQAWTDLCAFELENQAWCPSPSILWKVWKSITSACSLKGLSLDRSLDMHALAGTIEEDDIPLPLFHAVISKLQVGGGDTHAKVDPVKCVSWTGSVLLQSGTAIASSVAVVDFFRDWKDQLPEAWKKQATLEALQGMYLQPGPDIIRFKEDGPSTQQVPVNPTQPKATSSQARARNWHERFKNTRR